VTWTRARIAKAMVIALGCTAVGFGGGFTHEPHPDWENPQMIGRNKEMPRATAIPFADPTAALKRNPAGSPWHLSLNGEWSFSWSENPAQRPVDFYRIDYDVSAWNLIPVPANWQLHGYGYLIRLECRTTSTRLARTADHSQCLKTGTAARSISVSAA